MGHRNQACLHISPGITKHTDPGRTRHDPANSKPDPAQTRLDTATSERDPENISQTPMKRNPREEPKRFSILESRKYNRGHENGRRNQSGIASNVVSKGTLTPPLEQTNVTHEASNIPPRPPDNPPGTLSLLNEGHLFRRGLPRKVETREKGHLPAQGEHGQPKERSGHAPGRSHFRQLPWRPHCMAGGHENGAGQSC